MIEPVQHAAQTGVNIHTAVRWIFASQSAREATGTYVEADLHKIAFQSDDETYWGLVEVASPGDFAAPRWGRFGGGALAVNEPGETGNRVNEIEFSGAVVSFPSPGRAVVEIPSGGIRRRVAPDGNDSYVWLCADDADAQGPFVNEGNVGSAGNLTGDVENPAVLSRRAGWIAANAIEGRGNANFLQGSDSFSTENFTVSLWFRPKPIPPSGLNFFVKLPSAHLSGYAIMIGLDPSTGRLIGSIGKSNADGGGAVTVSAPSGAGYNDGAWHHAGITRNSNSTALRLYLDGDEAAAADFGGSLNTTGFGNWRVGENSNAHFQDIRIAGGTRNGDFFREMWKAGMLIP